MPQRNRTTIETIVSWENLLNATWRAATGKRTSESVRTFLQDLDHNLKSMRKKVLNETIILGQSTSFHVFDPKPRLIHAPVLSERVLHHAIMNYVGPVLEKTLIDDTFACRIEKGPVAAVQRAQQHCRRHAWFGKLDVRQYFASITHQTLNQMLERRFKSPALLRLLRRIVASVPAASGRGLPIGALTSQNLANFYLNPLDRFLLEDQKVGGVVRYMDDVVWWGDSKAQVRNTAYEAKDFLRDQLSLVAHSPMQVNRCSHGVPLCGFKVSPSRLLLSRRKRQRYRQGRRHWETRFQRQHIDALQLQAGYLSVLSMTRHSDSASWRKRELDLRPPVEI